MSQIKKVIVVGLDGLEPTLVEKFIADGDLPNIAGLLGPKGIVPRVRTTTPAQTPVAWSTFATGVNPGGHGIFDFLRRDPARYLPDLGLVRFEQPSPARAPVPVNCRGGTTLWQRLDKAGVPASVIRCPCTFPPDAFSGRQLSGMGVPDIRGGLGTATFYTSDEKAVAGESERLVPIKPQAGRPIRLPVYGPRKSAREDAQVDLTLRLEADGGAAVLQTPGHPHQLKLVPGQWSPWIRLKFRLSLLQSVRGMVRLLLVRTQPHFELYASPVNFDPQAPLFPISTPSNWANQLANEEGLFYTTGMVEDDSGLKNNRFDEDAFLDQCEDVWRERLAMLRHELERLDEGFVYCLFDTPDRIQHMFWRFLEPDHPANRIAGFDAAKGDAIRQAYRRSDEMVGQALAMADDRTLLVAMSDHGFTSFQRGVELNAWLREQNLLVLKSGVVPGEETSELLRGVDWSKTRAYAVGLSGIYLNVAGRESQGIVAPDEADALAEQIAAALSDVRDPARQTVGIRGAITRRRAYRGPYAEKSPDVMVHFAPGYRVAWQTAIGGIGSDVFEDNVKKWSGDHMVDPSLVPGMLVMNRPFDERNPAMVDLAPTVLAAFGVPIDHDLEGRSLLG